MKKNTKVKGRFYWGFLFGLGVCLVVGSLGFGGWVWTLYQTAKPALVLNAEAQKVKEPSAKEVEKIVEALITLGEIAQFFGIEELSSLTLGSTASVYGLKRDPTSILKAKFYFQKAVEEAQKLTQEETSYLFKSLNKYDPLLETYHAWGLFLKDIGETKRALKVLREGLNHAKATNPKSYWIKNLERALKYVKAS